MDVRLYVGNLAYATREDDLRAMFSEAGTVVSVTIIKDRDTGQSKGFGFIEMSSQAEAQDAITRFNGQSVGGRQLKVNLARPRDERPGGPRGRDGGDRRY